MRCRVIYTSMGYNGNIYCKGEYVEVDTPKEVERLVGYGAVKEADIPEPGPPQESADVPGTDIVKNVLKTGPKGKSRSKKK